MLELLNLLGQAVLRGFSILIPVTAFYALFIYIINRDTKEIRKEISFEDQKIIQEQLLFETLIPNDIKLLTTTINTQIVTKAPTLKYLRKPLHNKFKNKQLTQKLKHKNRYDKRLNFRG